MSRPRVALDPETAGAVRYLLADVRAIYRDARQFPNCAADLIPFAEYCRATVRALRAGQRWHVNEYGWIELDRPGSP